MGRARSQTTATVTASRFDQVLGAGRGRQSPAQPRPDWVQLDHLPPDNWDAVAEYEDLTSLHDLNDRSAATRAATDQLAQRLGARAFMQERETLEQFLDLVTDRPDQLPLQALRLHVPDHHLQAKCYSALRRGWKHGLAFKETEAKIQDIMLEEAVRPVLNEFCCSRNGNNEAPIETLLGPRAFQHMQAQWRGTGQEERAVQSISNQLSSGLLVRAVQRSRSKLNQVSVRAGFFKALGTKNTRISNRHRQP